MIGDKIKKNTQGFSLLEMLVAIGLFVVVVTLISDIFINSIMTQRQAIAVQANQESIRYAMEVMSKELRSARINQDPTAVFPMLPECANAFPLITGTDNKVYNFAGGSLFFRNRNGECVYYFINANNQLTVKRGDITLPLTPESVEITSFNVYIDDDAIEAFHSKQPNVTIRFDLENEYSNYGQITMQTSISSRHYE